MAAVERSCTKIDRRRKGTRSNGSRQGTGRRRPEVL